MSLKDYDDMCYEIKEMIQEALESGLKDVAVYSKIACAMRDPVLKNLILSMVADEYGHCRTWAALYYMYQKLDKYKNNYITPEYSPSYEMMPPYEDYTSPYEMTPPYKDYNYPYEMMSPYENYKSPYDMVQPYSNYEPPFEIAQPFEDIKQKFDEMFTKDSKDVTGDSKEKFDEMASLDEKKPEDKEEK